MMMLKICAGLVPGAGGAGAPCGAARGGGRTPSDAVGRAVQSEIERLRPLCRIDDILPLSPLQEGLLFHALYAAEAPDIYKVQLELSLQGLLEQDALKIAVQALLGRHASPARRLPAREPQPAGADHCVVAGAAVAEH